MTCIVGIADGEKVWLAGDRAAVTDKHYLSVIGAPKVFRNGDYVMGYTTSFRLGQILQYGFAPPVPDGGDMMAHMVTRFIPAVIAALRCGGWMETKDGRDQGGTFLVGVGGHLFVVESDFQVHIPRHGFAAVGSGISVAQGALWQSMPENCQRNFAPEQRLTMALEAASQFVTSVRGPFDLVCV